MKALEKLTSKVADQNVTMADVSAVVNENNQNILDLIAQNESNDVDARETLNAVVVKLNETLDVIGSDVPAPTPTPTDPDVPVPTDPAEEIPNPETPVEENPTTPEAPVEENPTTPETPVEETPSTEPIA